MASILLTILAVLVAAFVLIEAGEAKSRGDLNTRYLTYIDTLVIVLFLLALLYIWELN